MSPHSPDPMMRKTAPIHPTELSLWDHIGTVAADRTTAQIAGVAATLTMGARRRRILELLQEHGPQTLFELASKLGCHAHQISGRLTDLRADALIEFTGQRRPNPQTGCPAEVYRITNR